MRTSGTPSLLLYSVFVFVYVGCGIFRHEGITIRSSRGVARTWVFEAEEATMVILVGR